MRDGITRSAFAKQAGVSPAAVTQAVKAGIIVTFESEDGKTLIEPDHPVNRSYLESARANRGRSERQRESARAHHEQRIPEHKQAPARRAPLDPEAPADELPSKIEMEIRRLIQQEEKDRLANEERKGNLIPREVMIRKLDMLVSVLNNHFLPFARRMTPQITGELGVTDPELQLKIEEMLNLEMQRALSEFKREAQT
ncbi:hypothetical protein GWN42_31485 [candidate division KSB1 bacterium]|nr:hypothetical protein [candidate division KSB1 bacterium]